MDVRNIRWFPRYKVLQRVLAGLQFEHTIGHAARKLLCHGGRPHMGPCVSQGRHREIHPFFPAFSILRIRRAITFQ